MMSVVEKCGHDPRGNETYIDGGEIKAIEEEFSQVTKIYKSSPNRLIKGFDRLGFTLYEQFLQNGILIPRYYDPDTKNELEAFRNSGKFEMLTIQDMVRRGLLSIKGAGTTVGSQEYNIYETIPFLRTSDIGAWEIRNYAVQNVSELTYLKHKDKQNLKEGDILFVKDGTYRIGETVLLTKYDLKMLVQSHYLQIRSLDKEQLNPYLLLYLLHIPIVRKQIDEKTFVQATLSTIGNRLNEVLIPIPKDVETRKQIAKNIEEKISLRAEARFEMKQLFETNF